MKSKPSGRERKVKVWALLNSKRGAIAVHEIRDRVAALHVYGNKKSAQEYQHSGRILVHVTITYKLPKK